MALVWEVVKSITSNRKGKKYFINESNRNPLPLENGCRRPEVEFYWQAMTSYTLGNVVAEFAASAGE